MALSHDTQAQAIAEIDRRIAEIHALRQARALAQKLILHERHPDPMEYRNVDNPAHSLTRIRTIQPTLEGRVSVSQECKDHNSAVSELRKP
jgi:hypothetical protein